MLGDRSQPGILQLALGEVFEYKSRVREEKSVKVYVSYLEIYNEQLIDLLNPKGDHAQLKVKEDEQVGRADQFGIVVRGLRQQKVKNLEEAIHLLSFGEEYRKYRVTDFNEHSSRSHTIYKVYVECCDASETKSKRFTFSCLVAAVYARTWWI